MNSAEILKGKLVELLIKNNGDLTDSALATLGKEALENGIGDMQFNQLLQECVNLVQWKKRKKEKEVIPPKPENFVIILDERVTSLQQLGSVLFENPIRALEYLANEELFKAAINSLTNNDVNKIFRLLKVLKSESDPDKRFLKVIYYLNPALPYRTTSGNSADIQVLLDKSFQNYALYQEVYGDFKNNKIQVWLRAINAPQAANLPEDKSYLCFLAFVYSINAAHPFYLNNELFPSPVDLVDKARHESNFLELIKEPVNRENLMVWLNAIEQESNLKQNNDTQNELANAEPPHQSAAIDTLKKIINETDDYLLKDDEGNHRSLTEKDQTTEINRHTEADNASIHVPTEFEKNLELKIQSAQKKNALGDLTKSFANFGKGRKTIFFLATVVVTVILLIFFSVVYFTRSNHKKAVSEFKNNVNEKNDRAASEGNYSQANLISCSGNLYNEGNSLYQQKKYIDAFSVYKRSDAITTNDKSECMIGTMYFMGLGVTQNDSLALKWYLSSAKSNNPVAMYSLGLLYANGGKGVKKDIFKAYQYLTWVVENTKDENTKNRAKEKLGVINEQ